MAKIDDYLNFTVLGYFYDRLQVVFASATDLSALEAKVDDIIAEGGEPNVIEVIKKNGTALTVANKAVDVKVPEVIPNGMAEALIRDTDNDTSLTIYGHNINEGYVTMDFSAESYTGGDFEADLATTDYVDENGGKIDKIKVNNVEQTITNKAVNITVPEDLDDLTNTGSDPYAKMSDVESAQVGALKPKGSVAFASLPALTAANLNTYYNVTDSFTTTADFIEGAGKSYPAGTNVAIINTGTDASPVYKYDAMVGMTDLTGYWDKTELVAITTAQVDSLFS